MPTATKKRSGSNTGGTAVRTPTAVGTVMCRKIMLKEGTRTIFNGTYGENDWPGIFRKITSLYDGLLNKGTFTLSVNQVMARPTAHL